MIKFLAFFSLFTFCLSIEAKIVNIGIVLDGQAQRDILPIKQIKLEIIAITKGELQIQSLVFLLF